MKGEILSILLGANGATKLKIMRKFQYTTTDFFLVIDSSMKIYFSLKLFSYICLLDVVDCNAYWSKW